MAAVPEGACVDFVDFTDKDGYGCSDYSDLCVPRGLRGDVGQPIHDRVNYERFSNVHGHSALDACCVCGGGTRR